MIYRQIQITLSEEKVQRIKSLNEKVLRHLEDNFSLRLSILADLKAELSGIVKEMPEFIDVLERINRSGDYYDLQLFHGDNEMLNLPWNMATDPVSGRQLGNIQQLLISKGLPDYFKADKNRQSQLAPPLKILIMISSPEDADYKGRLSFEEEEMLILQAFQPLLQKGMVQIDYTDDGSLDALRRKTKTNKYHILHYSGHSDFKDGKGQLILEQALSLKTEKAQADDFADALNYNPEYKIPMVVLSSCQTAKGSNEAEICGVTNHLLKVGIPSIISMGMSIKDKYAAYFSASFYEQLADRQNIPRAFKSFAMENLREFECSEQAREGVTNPVPLQWIIPNLYRSARTEHLVDWDKAKTDLQFSSYRFVYEQERLLLKHEKNYLFIGRRRDKAKILPHLFDKKPIMLKGQGGVGKTAMAEHLVQRLITADADTQPFVFNETTKSIREVRKKLENYLDEKGQQYRTELNRKEEGLDQFNYLVIRVSALCEPVFVFDNLESFQTRPGGPFSEEYQNIKEVINSLCKGSNRQVILTGRYTIPDFEYVQSFDLNQAAINDFWKRCYYLELVKIAEYIHKNRTEKQERKALQKEELQFSDIVKLLHQNFGGNYRALEIFNELFKKDPRKIADALDTLDRFRDKYKSETEEVKTRMSKDLVFVDLLNLLETGQKEILGMMSHFRAPVQLFALQLQLSGRKSNNLTDNLLYLHDLTLLEISMDPETETVYYYSTPIVKDLLDTISRGPTDPSFSHQQAGTYYYYNHHNLSSSLTELEEAFYHFHLVRNKAKVQEIGDKLSGLYYSYSLYKNSFYYAGKVQQLLGEETGNAILNRLGMILYLYGDNDQALTFFQKTLSAYQEIGDKSGEGTTLNNISQTI